MKTRFACQGYRLNDATGIWLRTAYESIAYSDGDEIEQRIAEIIQNAQDRSVLSSELRAHCTDWPAIYHLSSQRSNLLRPFSADLQGSILEIGAGCGAITRFLGESGAQVLALEGSLRRAGIARSRTMDLPNVTVVADRFEHFHIDQRFDVITLIGVLEYAGMFSAHQDPAWDMLRKIHALLKPHGKLIIAIENQLGLKYFAGAPEDHLGQAMYGLEGRYRQGEPQTFGRRYLQHLIQRAGFDHTRFLLPFPDYKLPVCILTEEGLHQTDFDAAELICQTVTKDAQLPTSTNFSQERVWPVLHQNGLLRDLTNSFLIVASNDPSVDLESRVLGHYFSTDRSPPFCKETMFVRHNDNQIRVKRHAIAASDCRPCSDHEFSYTLSAESPYIRGRTLYREFLDIITQPGWRIDTVRDYFSRYLNMISDIAKAEGHAFDTSSPASMLPGDFLDAIPANIVVTEQGQPIFVDREWSVLAGVPVDYLLFRAIISLLGSVSAFSTPENPAHATRGGFLLAIMKDLGLTPTENDLCEFLRRESNLSIFASGVANRRYTTWHPEADLPGYSNPSLQARLEQTEAAKAFAEELAFARMAENDHLLSQLQAMGDAKAYAEKLAIERLDEIEHLTRQLLYATSQLDAIQASRGFRILTRMKLLPQNQDKSNV